MAWETVERAVPYSWASAACGSPFHEQESRADAEDERRRVA